MATEPDHFQQQQGLEAPEEQAPQASLFSPREGLNYTCGCLRSPSQPQVADQESLGKHPSPGSQGVHLTGEGPWHPSSLFTP